MKKGFIILFLLVCNFSLGQVPYANLKRGVIRDSLNLNWIQCPAWNMVNNTMAGGFYLNRLDTAAWNAANDSVIWVYTLFNHNYEPMKIPSFLTNYVKIIDRDRKSTRLNSSHRCI